MTVDKQASRRTDRDGTNKVGPIGIKELETGQSTAALQCGGVLYARFNGTNELQSLGNVSPTDVILMCHAASLVS